jgi:hypothetical protein
MSSRGWSRSLLSREEGGGGASLTQVIPFFLAIAAASGSPAEAPRKWGREEDTAVRALAAALAAVVVDA